MNNKLLFIIIVLQKYWISVAQLLGHWLLVQRVRGSNPRSPSTFRDLFIGPLRTARLVNWLVLGLKSWLISFSIELVLGPTTWVHFLLVHLEEIV